MILQVLITLARFAGIAWAMPNTLLGIVLGGLSLDRPQRAGQALEIHLHRGIVRASCRLLRISAFTLGNCVLYAQQADDLLRVHEGRHITQYLVLGPLFLPVYFALLAVYGYNDHPFERDAQLFTTSVRKRRSAVHWDESA